VNIEPLLFLTNDDGIESPGLMAAADAASSLGELLIVAPTFQQSAMGRALCGGREERLRPMTISFRGLPITAYHCDCSPATAVSLGLDLLCAKRKPALLISGINYGENIGLNITTSGTIGAALEGASYGIPALAVSLQTSISAQRTYSDLDWRAAAHFTKFFSERVLSGKLPEDVDALKIDVPANATPQTPWRITTVSRQFYYHRWYEAPTPESKLGDAKIKIVMDDAALEPGSDIHALAVEQAVSVAPISLNLTSRASASELRKTLSP
jgi:5'-nucleotidase